MTHKKYRLLKFSLLFIFLPGMVLKGAAQNNATMGDQTISGNAAVSHQSAAETIILLILAALVFVFFIIKYMRKRRLEANRKPAPETAEIRTPLTSQPDPQGEIHAAIAMALYLYSNELHDQENPVLTMIRVSKTYSPWSSKIYGLRKLPR